MRHFFEDPSKPPVFTIARADERKNLPGLVRAFSGNKWLKENANLIVIGGNRQKLDKLPPPARKVWMELLRTIDDGGLYGSIAYPKTHKAPEVAGLYQWCAARNGVFVNPAFTEPFGLTLLEAAAAGLPLVATQDGGPKDIIANCQNGTLVDPCDDEEMGNAIEAILSDPTKQEHLSETGYREVRIHYSWDAHVKRYLEEVFKILPPAPKGRRTSTRGALVERERWVVMDLLPRIEEEPEELVQKWRELFDEYHVGFGIATGLSFAEAWEVIQRCGMPEPGFVISGLGAEIRYGETGVLDEPWRNQIGTRWNRQGVLDTFASFDSLTLQEERFQDQFKVSYLMDSNNAIGRLALQRALRENGFSGKVIVTAKAFVDVIPIRSGKDVALRYLQNRWGIDPSRIFYFGTYGNDIAAVRGRNVSVLAGDADRVLRQLHSRPRLFHSQGKGLAGFFEGLDHFEFLEGTRLPRPGDEADQGEEDVPAIELHP